MLDLSAELAGSTWEITGKKETTTPDPETGRTYTNWNFDYAGWELSIPEPELTAIPEEQKF